MKPEAQVPSEGSLFQSRCLPGLCVARPTAAGPGEAVGKVVQLEAAGGPGSRPRCLRHPGRTTVETGSPHCGSAPFGSRPGLCLRFHKKLQTGHVSTDSFFLTQRATGFFF